jgi:hypothetical protein
MKVGDMIRYKYLATDGQRDNHHSRYKPALILYVNEEGGTLKVLGNDGQIDWYVTSYSELISEGR